VDIFIANDDHTDLHSHSIIIIYYDYNCQGHCSMRVGRSSPWAKLITGTAAPDAVDGSSTGA